MQNTGLGHEVGWDIRNLHGVGANSRHRKARCMGRWVGDLLLHCPVGLALQGLFPPGIHFCDSPNFTVGPAASGSIFQPLGGVSPATLPRTQKWDQRSFFGPLQASEEGGRKEAPEASLTLFLFLYPT